ncbi:substrate-binding domain-containing protein [Psychromarinibacter sp. C21-152]|uniref:Substrate-binding domain-containing protein n=1 Tax=Psychromarinibacter sediminicola TaxID=3033385 RepID=A0AAE3NWN7_9RHOB|nr:substrate-binding domain-containing protein [Psychromarinibacter sediminicola]MDF0603492.1 substrate-binding domain-containing protein [Psychromarinibacter sediminicola]
MNLKQLSEKLGLSQTTVSRALNGYPEVAEATRAKVLKAAETHNYRPNARAKSLATGRAMAVGHVLPVSNKGEIVNPVFSDFVAGASETYLQHGYDMMLSLVPDDAEEDAYRALAAKGTVDGIIVHGPRTDDARVGLLREIGLPFVVHGRISRRGDDYDWVDVNNLRAFQRATEFLLDFGHRRIALINGMTVMDFAERRLAGYCTALQDRGVAVDDGLIRSDQMTEGYGYASAQEMLAQHDAPTAFLCSSMIAALGVRRAVEERGLRMARDISIITHDDDLSYLSNGGEVPIFTATRSSVRQAGRLCAERVIDLVQNPGQAPQQHLLEAELMVGQSTGPAPQRM